MDWTDIEEIAEQLDQTYPDVDPCDLLLIFNLQWIRLFPTVDSVSIKSERPILTHLERMIVELPDFHAKNASADQAVLLKIQKEWDRIRQ
jgi:FeS assembly protein IscX